MKAGKKERHAGRRGAGAVAGGRSGKPEATRVGGRWQSPTLPRNWRDRLPDPGTYYGSRIEKLGKANGQGWAQGRCPLHEDQHESLSVKLGSQRGFWRCFAGCGHGDVVTFHERLMGLPFKEAVRDLVGVHV